VSKESALTRYLYTPVRFQPAISRLTESAETSKQSRASVRIRQGYHIFGGGIHIDVASVEAKRLKRRVVVDSDRRRLDYKLHINIIR